MENYKILIKKSAAEELSGGIPKKDVEKIVQRIFALNDEPRPSGCRKLSGAEGFRLRQGDYRIVYTVDDARRIVTIYKIGHRREIYCP